MSVLAIVQIEIIPLKNRFYTASILYSNCTYELSCDCDCDCARNKQKNNVVPYPKEL